MRQVLKRSKEKGVCDTLFQVIAFPLKIIRDLTIPMAEEDKWDRRRACVIPITLVISFMWLGEMFNDEDTRVKLLTIALFAMVPGAMFSLLIHFKTSKT